MKSPIESAKAATPIWMMEIFSYDAIEIHPVRDTRWNDTEQGIRPFCKDRDNDTGCEPCAPHEAHFWSVYGHQKEGGIVCFADYATETKARDFADLLIRAYRHLSM